MLIENMLTTMFDIKYYKNIWIHVICVQVLAHFITPPPYFDRVSIISMLSIFFLITICSHCFQYVFIFSV